MVLKMCMKLFINYKLNLKLNSEKIEYKYREFMKKKLVFLVQILWVF